MTVLHMLIISTHVTQRCFPRQAGQAKCRKQTAVCPTCNDRPASVQHVPCEKRLDAQEGPVDIIVIDRAEKLDED